MTARDILRSRVRNLVNGGYATTDALCLIMRNDPVLHAGVLRESGMSDLADDIAPAQASVQPKVGLDLIRPSQTARNSDRNAGNKSPSAAGAGKRFLISVFDSARCLFALEADSYQMRDDPPGVDVLDGKDKYSFEGRLTVSATPAR